MGRAMGRNGVERLRSGVEGLWRSLVGFRVLGRKEENVRVAIGKWSRL